MQRGKHNEQVRQIGIRLVHAELGRQGITATVELGSVPTCDVLAADAQRRRVPIKVKSSRMNKWQTNARTWMQLEIDPHSGIQHFRGPKHITNPDLIYVCVVVAPPGERNRFFVLTHKDIQEACIQAYSDWMEPHEWKRPKKPDSFHCTYEIAHIEQFENNWQLIAQRLEASAPDASLTTAG